MPAPRSTARDSVNAHLKAFFFELLPEGRQQHHHPAAVCIRETLWVGGAGRARDGSWSSFDHLDAFPAPGVAVQPGAFAGR
jgi:hypothetical protein